MKLRPDGIHVGDKWNDEIVIAYGYYNDQYQSVITMVPKKLRLIYPNQGVNGGNYHTFFLDMATGTMEYSNYHWNIVQAVNRYTEEMGMDI